MPLGAILGTIIQTAGGVGLARTVGGFITKLNKRIFPFKGGSDEERMLYQHHLSEEQTRVRQRFEAQLHQSGLANQREITYLSALFNRQTTLQNTVLNFQNALKSKMFDEALRNYPLNIPPLVMLQNAGLSTNSVTGELVVDDPITRDVLSIADNGTNQHESLLSQYKSVFRKHPIALSVFVTPLTVDSRVPSREKISTIVWDNIFQELESLFINEYNRGGSRPVYFYPASWNNNAKPGLHASEVLYFFTKGMPVVVLEPRYDGKQIRFIFSCWGIGSEPDKLIRQEIIFNLDWNSIVLPAMYERSKNALIKLNRLKEYPSNIADIKKKLEHNVFLYERLKDIDALSDASITDDISKLFYMNNDDFAYLSKTMSDALGISISLIADVHHLTSRGINPHFPELLETSFAEAFKSLTKPARKELLDAVKGLMKSAYMELLLGDIESDNSYYTFESQVAGTFEFSDAPSIIDGLKTIRPIDGESNVECVENVEVSEQKSIPEIINLINQRCNELSIEQPTLSLRVEELRKLDSQFIHSIEQICKEQLITIDDLTVL